MPKPPKPPRTPRTPKLPRSRASGPRSASVTRHKETIRRSSDESRFRASTVFYPQIGVVMSQIDDEAVIADPLLHRHFRMNGTGVFLWQHAMEGKTLSQIAAVLENEYEIGQSKAREVAEAFLGELVENGLLVNSTNG